MTDSPGGSNSSATNQGSDYRRVKKASIRGAGVGLATIVLQVVLQMISVVVLARLLTPEDFGLVAMAMTFVSIMLIVADWGLIMASTQRRHIDQDQLTTLFWINVGGGMILAILVIASSYLLVLIFSEPRLVGVAVVLSLKLVAIGIGAQHEAIIRRQLRYGTLHAINLISHAVGFAGGVAAALVGMGFWALVGQLVIVQVSRTVLLWTTTRWKPARPRWASDVRPFLKYGISLAPADVLFSLSLVVDGMLIGAAAGPSELGLYRKANSIVNMPIDYLKRALGRMVPSSLSRLQDDGQAFSSFFNHAFAMLSLAGCAVVGLVATEAPAVVNVLLGDQWLSAIPLVRWLALRGLVSTMGVATLWILVPRGDMKKLLTLRALRLCIIIVGVLVGWRWGTVGVAAGYSLASSFSIVIELFVISSVKGVRMGSLIGSFIRPITAAGAAGSIVFLIDSKLSVVTLLSESCLYLLVFLAAHAALPGGWNVMRRALRSIQRETHPQPAS